MPSAQTLLSYLRVTCRRVLFTFIRRKGTELPEAEMATLAEAPEDSTASTDLAGLLGGTEPGRAALLLLHMAVLLFDSREREFEGLYDTFDLKAIPSNTGWISP